MIFSYRCTLNIISGGLVFICLFYASMVGAVEFTPKERAYLDKHPRIRVHNEMGWPPFNFNRNGVPQGISIDVMNRIAAIAGLNISYVTGPSWNEFLGMMNSGDLDVMLNIVSLPERRKNLRFTTAYANSLTGIYVKKGHPHPYYNFKGLSGKTVAVPSGFDLEINMAKYHPDVRILSVRDTLSCIEAVLSGKADAFMEELGVVDYILSQRMIPDIRMAFQVDEEAFISSLRIATSGDNTLLFGIIQKSLNGLSGDELHRIRQKWLLNVTDLYEKSMVSLTTAEKEYLYANPQVKICVDPSWPPLDFITEDGLHDGLSADLSRKLAKRLGITFNLIPTTTWDQSLEYIREGRCEVIPLMNETRESRSFINFSEPYFKFPTVIAARKEASFVGDYSDLNGKTIALQSHFFITEYVKKNYPDIKIIEVENTREALKLVSGQKAFATIDGLPGIVNIIEALALENVKIVGSVPQENQMKLGVRKGNSLLVSIFNKGISSLSEKEKVGLYKKWFDIDIETRLYNRPLVLKVGLAIFCIVMFLVWRQVYLGRYARRLKRLNEKLEYAATYDHLTGILNRKSIEARLKIEMEKSKLSSEPLTLVIMDIDHFKSLNDAYGHLTGDRILKAIAGLVRGSIRRSDHFGRWGGEEFLIVLPNTQSIDAHRIMNALRERIAEKDMGIDRPVTVCMGVGQHRSREGEAAWLTRVDDCLYAAKESGRNRVVTSEHV